MPLKRLPTEDEKIVEIPVRTDRAGQFRNLENQYGEELNVVELHSESMTGKGMLLMIIACKPENEEKLSHLGFMTFIDNPKFQDTYS
jgi:hypothetical protein